jgi:dTDP-4-dehydrorhamnose reductase
MTTVAISGASGLVGSRIVELLQDSVTFIPVSQEQVDITDKNAVDSFISSSDFDVFLHLAAYTDVDKAEQEKDLVYTINVEGTRNVLDAVVAKGKRFIYISTDFVFDGTAPPYDENSVPNPMSVYGQSKYEGEKLVSGKGTIVRIAFPYRKSFAERPDFVRSIKSLLEEKKQLKMVTDALITPTFIDDIAYGLQHLFTSSTPELVHLTGSESLSPHEAGLAIARAFNLDESLIGKTTFAEYYTGKAPRPQFSQTVSINNTFHRMKTFAEGLSEIA